MTTRSSAREADAGWMAAGLCRSMEPDLFFPSDLAGFSAAAKICESCPVRQPCLEYALENRITEGVWGGASQRERMRILRRRRAASGASVEPTPPVTAP